MWIGELHADEPFAKVNYDFWHVEVFPDRGVVGHGSFFVVGDVHANLYPNGAAL